MTPFDFINEINHGKKNLMADDIDRQVEKKYKPFIVNRGLSYFMDTVFDANEMNIRPNIENKLQFEYLLNNIRQKKRFSKWHKADENELLTMLMEYYSFNIHRAKEALPLHSKEQLEHIRKIHDKGELKGA